MRYKIWITLIVCGTLIVLAPPASDWLANEHAARVITERKDLNNVSFGLAPMSSEYRFGCWALGAAMIGVGVVGGWREESGGTDGLA